MLLLLKNVTSPRKTLKNWGLKTAIYAEHPEKHSAHPLQIGEPGLCPTYFEISGYPRWTPQRFLSPVHRTVTTPGTKLLLCLRAGGEILNQLLKMSDLWICPKQSLARVFRLTCDQKS